MKVTSYFSASAKAKYSAVYLDEERYKFLCDHVNKNLDGYEKFLDKMLNMGSDEPKFYVKELSISQLKASSDSMMFVTVRGIGALFARNLTALESASMISADGGQISATLNIPIELPQ